MNTEETTELKEEIQDLKEQLETLESNGNEDEYNNSLDEMGEVHIGNLTYSTSHALKIVDPTAYNCGLNDYNSEKITEVNDEIESKEAELNQLKEEVEE